MHWRKGLLIGSGFLALAVALWFYPVVFPISGLRIRVSRAEAAEIADRFLKQMNVQVPAGYTRATTFEIDGWAKAYLEQTLGIPQANRVAQEQGFVYVWYTRWFRPGKEREFRVAVDPDGRVLGFYTVIPTDAPMPPSRQPKQIAEQFVQQRIGDSLRAYRLVEEYQTPYPKRVEHTFVWERTDTRLAEARERVAATVSGDQVIAFTRYLHYPERFSHTFRWHRTRGSLITMVASNITLLFGVALVLILLFGAARRELRLRVAVAPAVLVTVVRALNYLNGLPLRLANMDTSQTWSAFWTREIITSLLASLFSGLSVGLVVVAADLVYRKAFPEGIPLQHWFSRRGWAHAEGKKRIELGYWLFAIKLLYIVLFLTAARRFLGAWASSVVPYDDLLSTAAPWAYPMLVGIEAALEEEFLFRVFIIFLFQRYLKSAWAGILVSAVVWSALHASYPTVPYYLRVIELLPTGILYGWVVWWYGPLPTILAHAAYNAAISSDIFLYSTELWSRLSFVVVAIAILLPAVLAWRWARRFPSDAALIPATNRDIEGTTPVEKKPAPAEPEPMERQVVFPRLQRRSLWMAIAVLIAAVALGEGWDRWFERQQRFEWAKGERNPLRLQLLDAHRAVKVARQYLPQGGAEVNGWAMSIKQLGARQDERYGYLRRFLSKADADELWARVQSPDDLWAVRWWQPGTRNEWMVLITLDGKFWERYFDMPEEAPGKSISRDAAQQLAMAELKRVGFALERLKRTGADTRTLPARSSHRFIWEIDGLKVGEAQFQVVVDVEGDKVAGIYRDIVVPSSYFFEQEVATVRIVAGTFAIVIVALILFVWSWRVTVRLMREHAVPWRQMVAPALVVSGLGLALFALNYREWVAGTPSTLSPQVYGISGGVFALVVTLLLFIGVMSLAPYVPGGRKVFPNLPDITDWWRVVIQPRCHKVIWQEAMLAQAGIWAALIVLILLVESIDMLALPGNKPVTTPAWMTQIAPADTDAPIGIVSYSPELFALLLALLFGMIALWIWLGGVVSCKLMFGHVRRGVLWYLLLFAPGALVFREWWEAAQYLAGILGFLVLVWLLYRWILRDNPLTVFVFVFHAVLLLEGQSMLPYTQHRAGGVVLILLVVACVGWGLVSWLLGRKGTMPAPAVQQTEVAQQGDRSREAIPAAQDIPSSRE